MQASDLPIYAIADAFAEHLSHGNRVVITAPTGSGKSTQVPRFLRDCSTLSGKILVLQPRRLAARVLAERVAEEWGEACGVSVGFRTRFEHCGTHSTRVWFITEGLLVRMMMGSVGLAGVGAVVFDEFHERSLASDIGLGLVCDVQATLSALKIVVMSATLDADAVCRYLGGAPHLHAGGRLYPVETTYLPKAASPSIWEDAGHAVASLLRSECLGDILVFMPGIYEIQRTVSLCRQRFSNIDVLPLYGDLPADQQHEVLKPGPRRRLIVATNIAETSLTLPGVRHVIDSGLVRLNRYDHMHGINKLETTPISREAAEQRAGRAGREAPGSCCRLWSLAEQHRKPARTVAEIHRADLCESMLQLLFLRVGDPAVFPWFEVPDADAVDRAVLLLRDLGFVRRGSFELTPAGEEAVQVPIHPRLAKLLLVARDVGCLDTAALAAAVLSERPLLLPKARYPEHDGVASDLWAAVSLVRQANDAHFTRDACEARGMNASAARQIWRTGQHILRICRQLGWERDEETGGVDAFAACVLRAFPDRLARRRDTGTLVCELRHGRTATLARESGCRHAALLVAGECRETGGGGRAKTALLSLATEVKEEWLMELFADDWLDEDEIIWDEQRRQVQRRTRSSCLGVTIEEKLRSDVDPDKAAEILAQHIADGRLVLKGWTKEVDAWIARVRWVAGVFPDRGLLLYDDTDVAVLIREVCAGCTQYKQVKDKPCLDMVKHALPWADVAFIDQMAPPIVTLPSGRRMKIDYVSGQPPKGKARIQDLYGVETTPRVAGGRVPVLLDILAPNMRTVQITDDMSTFWRDTYPALRKQYAPRYTRHEWR